MPSTRLGIVYIQEAQENKEVTANDAFNTIDAAVVILDDDQELTGDNEFSGESSFTGNFYHSGTEFGIFGATGAIAPVASEDLFGRLQDLGILAAGTMPVNTNGADVTANNLFFSGAIKGSNTPVIYGHLLFSFPLDADYTLPAADTANKYLVINAGVLTATRNLILPLTAGSEYCIVNNNAQSVVVKGATGTGPTIASGRTAWVRCGGANYFRTTADVAH